MSIDSINSQNVHSSTKKADKQSLKFNLYLKNKEIVALRDMLDEITRLPLNEQSAWVDDYGQVIEDALDRFVEDSNSVFENLIFDDEILALSQEFVVTLRETIRLMDSIFSQTEMLDLES